VELAAVKAHTNDLLSTTELPASSAGTTGSNQGSPSSCRHQARASAEQARILVALSSVFPVASSTTSSGASRSNGRNTPVGFKGSFKAAHQLRNEVIRLILDTGRLGTSTRAANISHKHLLQANLR